MRRAVFSSSMRPRRRSPGLVLATAVTVSAPCLAAVTLAPADAATTSGIAYTEWAGGTAFGTGTIAGLRVSSGRLRIGEPVGTREYVDPHGGASRRYSYGHWTSPWTSPGFGLTELVPSWDARTPGSSWVQVAVRGATATGDRTSWDTLANWAAGDAGIHRTSLGAQTDDLARVATDTWVTDAGVRLASWQVRVTLLRPSDALRGPALEAVGAMASDLPSVSSFPTSAPGVAGGIRLPVPEYSQMTHSGHYPQYGNGGEAWCSPTATSMVLGYYGRLPSPEAYSWVDTADRDRFVDHAARMTYDYEYDGTGNWSFNTAYAARHADAAFVTRLRSLREAERFIASGIPLVASIAFGSGDLDGAPISSTNGHLVVIAGFTAAGNVVVNDPAAASNDRVQRVYDRGQFENAWLPKSGGLVYVIHPDDRPLPRRGLASNW